MNPLYRAAGLSKQAYFQHRRRREEQDALTIDLFNEVDRCRQKCGGIGMRALYWKIQPDWLGRDRFEDLLAQNGYRVKRKRAYHRTTRAGAYCFPNLINGRILTGPGQVIQSDTTYYRIGERHYYLTFIEDVYTRMIIGYAVSNRLKVEANLRSLRMALRFLKRYPGLYRVHHSDRGSQYSSHVYRKALEQAGIHPSMCKSAQENAYVERLHGTIKNQYLAYRSPRNETELRRYVRQIVNHYNKERLHRSLGMKSPKQFLTEWEAGLNRPIEKIDAPSLNMEKVSQDLKVYSKNEGPYCLTTWI